MQKFHETVLTLLTIWHTLVCSFLFHLIRKMCWFWSTKLVPPLKAKWNLKIRLAVKMGILFSVYKNCNVFPFYLNKEVRISFINTYKFFGGSIFNLSGWHFIYSPTWTILTIHKCELSCTCLTECEDCNQLLFYSQAARFLVAVAPVVSRKSFVIHVTVIYWTAPFSRVKCWRRRWQWQTKKAVDEGREVESRALGPEHEKLPMYAAIIYDRLQKLPETAPSWREEGVVFGSSGDQAGPWVGLGGSRAWMGNKSHFTSYSPLAEIQYFLLLWIWTPNTVLVVPVTWLPTETTHTCIMSQLFEVEVNMLMFII